MLMAASLIIFPNIQNRHNKKTTFAITQSFYHSKCYGNLIRTEFELKCNNVRHYSQRDPEDFKVQLWLSLERGKDRLRSVKPGRPEMALKMDSQIKL